MARIEINFDVQSALNAMTAMSNNLKNTEPMLGEMGNQLIRIHRERFQSQLSPDGVPWAALRPWYRDSKSRNKDKVLTLTGQLADTLRYQIVGSTLFFGTDKPYGAIHQFGGEITPKNAKALNVGGRPVKKVVIPPRPWLGTSSQDAQNLLAIAQQFLSESIRT